ncbi:disks large homolog 5 isoform X3 [Aethina tumida]|uniref:disks large homolog 5 isoform X3 n=1 Tax=Aethina tumida TaxID=116153 RepID=UPI00096B3964|nr:disks large homolog 5 isoform X3 [Aethina tumida]XP_019881518.1 disks large homolog 5 isoform X3 [Aethina tumida]
MASNSDGSAGSNGSRNFDVHKQVYENTGKDLVGARRKCDHPQSSLIPSMCDYEYYVEQHRAAMNQLEVTSLDSATLRVKYTELLTENKRLEQENQCVRNDLQEHKDEKARLMQQCDSLGQERTLAIREMSGLKQQLIKFYNNYVNSREVCQKLKQQYESVTGRLNKEITQLTDERNAAMTEYTLTMSERDTVHKEMEKLSDDLAQAVKKIKMLDSENKDLQDEKRGLNFQLESLRREISSALQERDKAIKECNDLRQKFGELGASSEGHLLTGDHTKKSRGRLIDSLGHITENGGRKEHLREDARSIGQRQRLDNLDKANEELEMLRKALDKAQLELAEAVQEAEVSKGRRDWAFSERDKIVLERESIRTLCDNMRKERDRTVTELAESLRESDALKIQRNELMKEMKQLREAFENQLEQNRMQEHDLEHQCGHTEVVELEISPSDTEGVELAGSVYVDSVAPGSLAIGKLFPHDRILRVNDVDCSQVSQRMVSEAIKSSMPVARLLVKRTRCARSEVRTNGDQVTKWCHTARLAPACHGLSLRMGFYISRISDGSLAARDKSLTVGDRVLRINDKSMDDVESEREAMQILNDGSADVINLTTLKMSYPECPNVFQPVRRVKKEKQNTTQTEDWLGDGGKYGSPSVSSNSVVQQEKNGSGAWYKKFDMRGRRQSKEDKKKHRNSIEHEQINLSVFQVMAEFDSVIDHYQTGSTGLGTVKRNLTKRHSTSYGKEEKNNGGTWPKARNTQLLLQGATGTVVTRKRERPPLSVLHTTNDSDYTYRNSVTIPPVQQPVPQTVAQVSNRHTVYKTMESAGSVGGRQFGGVSDSFEKLRTAVGASNRCSVNSLDYQVQHRCIDVVNCTKKHRSPKYSSDSERDSIIGGPTADSAVVLHMTPPSSQLFGGARGGVGAGVHYSFHPHPHPTLVNSRDSITFEPPPFHQHPHHHHVHSPSADVGGNAARRAVEHLGGGTFPRKRGDERFRVPSNPSVTGKGSTGCIERGSSDRGSPMPKFHVEVLSSPGDHSGSRAVTGSKDCCSWGPHKPLVGELRRVHIDKSNEPLGIQINCSDTGGIFVSTVNENSLASRVGLQIGDQLLEVCGINMRKATYNVAANVLRQCGNSITMLVQYSPDKYHELDGGSASCSGGSLSNDDDLDDDEGEGEATPCNSPKEVRKSSGLQIKPGALSSIQRQINGAVQPPSRITSEEPRYLVIETLKTSNLGISLVGGNAAGIFIHSVHSDSLAYLAGLRTGDQILEYNNCDLRNATAEEAAYELAKPADKVTVLAHYRIDEYNEIKDNPGDSFYVRCGFDRTGNENTEPPELTFSKDEVLYVDNTMFNGVPGQWRAWRLDADGHRQQCGVIPSKYKVEEELLLRRGAADMEAGGRSTATARRSFFRRKKHRSGSGLGSNRDSKELASFCPGWYSDSGSLHEDLSQNSYQRVERLLHPEFRPVLVLGPLSECVADKLVTDFPEKFQRPVMEQRHCSQMQLDRDLIDGQVVEYRRRGSGFECLTVAALRAVAQSRLHCMLDASIACVERLHRHHIYPVVLLIKFKSTKQIKEVKDTRQSSDKLSGKAAKEMYEHGHKLEADHRHLVTAVVPAGANVAHVCTQVKTAVELEHRKSQWVPLSLH